jgi:hypothetical protein
MDEDSLDLNSFHSAMYWSPVGGHYIPGVLRYGLFGGKPLANLSAFVILFAGAGGAGPFSECSGAQVGLKSIRRLETDASVGEAMPPATNASMLATHIQRRGNNILKRYTKMGERTVKEKARN